MTFSRIVILYNILLVIFVDGLRWQPHYKQHNESDIKPWTGKWFPHPPTTSFPQQDLSSDAPKHDSRIPMGVYNPDCDDAKTKLEVDWFGDPSQHTCSNLRTFYTPNEAIHPIYEIEEIPPMYKAAHSCMNESISYSDDIPTFGTHRPLWPKWGEYIFLPKQRWLHNLEHGGIVMLYHPCANQLEVKKLRNLVVKCLYRHVISPYDMLSSKRPLALVAWGRKLQMSVVSEKVVVEFIKEAALHGAEHTARDGQYDFGLLNHAKIVTNELDDKLCAFN